MCCQDSVTSDLFLFRWQLNGFHTREDTSGVAVAFAACDQRSEPRLNVFSACDLPPRTMCQILMAVLHRTLLLIKLILIGLKILHKGKPLEVWLTKSAFGVSRTFANPASTRPASEGLNEKADHAKSYRRKGCEMSLPRALLCLSQTMNQSAIYVQTARKYKCLHNTSSQCNRNTQG